MSYFNTQIDECGGTLSGPFRSPVQMLDKQDLGKSASIHDDSTAEKLGFRGGTIEGPTHFSQFDPLAERLWGESWITNGCISAHFRAPAFEGDELKAFIKRDPAHPYLAEVWLIRRDGTEILRGSASVHPYDGPTALSKRMDSAPPLLDPVMHADLRAGMTSDRVPVRMDPAESMGSAYPFSLDEKIEVITEKSEIYSSDDNKWASRIVPLEMISVMIQSPRQSGYFKKRGPAIGLFADLEVRLVNGPVLAEKDYEVSREICALTASRRTESMWIRSRLWEKGTDNLVAEMLLNEAMFKGSYQPYAAEYAALYGKPPLGFES